MTRLCPADVQKWSAALSAFPTDPKLLMPWVLQSVQPFFPFTRIWLLNIEIVASELRVTELLQHGDGDADVPFFPDAIDLRRAGGRAAAWWVENRAPYFIDRDDPAAFVPVQAVEQMRRLGIEHFAGHGVLNATGTSGTFFGFDLSRRPGEWHLDALRLIAPMLNDVFVRYLAVSGVAASSVAALTPRQMDIVRLAARGLCSKRIARELDLSDKTVRNRLSEVYEHLGVRDCRGLLAALR